MAYTMDYPTRQLFYQWLDQKDLDNVCLNKLGITAFNNNIPVTYQVPLLNPNNRCFGSVKWVGIDIPVLIHPDPNKSNGETLVIVGISALRDKNNNCPSGHAWIGCPFAVNNLLGIPKQCDVYKLIFEKLLNCGYTLYLTDAVKVWWDGKKLSPYQCDMAIFVDEIKTISSSHTIKAIVTWGKIAENFVKPLTINNQQTPIIPVMHPGQRNWGKWKKCLNSIPVNNSPNAKNNCLNGKKSCNANIISDLVFQEIMKQI